MEALYDVQKKSIWKTCGYETYILIDSGLVLPCYNVCNPSISLSQSKEIDCFKLYLSDFGLFTTMIFNDSENGRDMTPFC